MRGLKTAALALLGVTLLVLCAYGVQALRLKRQMQQLMSSVGALPSSEWVKLSVSEQRPGPIAAEVALKLELVGPAAPVIIPFKLYYGPLPLTRHFGLRGAEIVFFQKEDFSDPIDWLRGYVDFDGTVHLEVAFEKDFRHESGFVVHPGKLAVVFSNDLGGYNVSYSGGGVTYNQPPATLELSKPEFSLQLEHGSLTQRAKFAVPRLSVRGEDFEWRLEGIEGQQQVVYAAAGSLDNTTSASGSIAKIVLLAGERRAQLASLTVEGSGKTQGGIVSSRTSGSCKQGEALGKKLSLDEFSAAIENFDVGALQQLSRVPGGVMGVMADPQVFADTLGKILDAHPRLAFALHVTSDFGSGQLAAEVSATPTPLFALMSSGGRAALAGSLSLQLDETAVKGLLQSYASAQALPDPAGRDVDPTLELLLQKGLLVKQGELYRTTVAFQGDSPPTINGKLLEAADLLDLNAARAPAMVPRLLFQFPGVEGPRDPTHVQGMLMRGAGALQECWRSTPEAHILPSGEFDLSFAIQPAGNVTAARIRNELPAARVLDACLTRQVQTLQFDSATGATRVQVVVKYIVPDASVTP